jgi:hypothetical protein
MLMQQNASQHWPKELYGFVLFVSHPLEAHAFISSEWTMPVGILNSLLHCEFRVLFLLTKAVYTAF